MRAKLLSYKRIVLACLSLALGDSLSHSLNAQTGILPSASHQVSLQVPTRLKIARTTDELSVTIDTNGFNTANIMVGTNTVMGVQGKLFIYPAGGTRPTDCTRLAQSGELDFNLGTGFWHRKTNGFPIPGKSYVVEMDLTIFQTDTPGGHLEIFPWSTNSQIVWKRTLKQVVQ